MPGWKCFLVETSGFCRRSLRRFKSSTETHYHDASVVIDEQIPCPKDYGGRSKDGYEAHPLWPKACPCGYAFQGSDYWQVNEDRLYHGAPDGKFYPMRELPPGAIWRATWMEDIQPPNPYAAPDGKVWALMLPAGMEWLIYGPATGGGKWDVQGALPEITVSPSISQVGFYHGFVKGGIITPDCEGRSFPKHPFTA